MIDKINITKTLDRYISEIISFHLLLFYYLRKLGHINIERRPVLEKILLIKLWGMGNVTALLPIIKKFKEQYADADLFFLTFDLNKGLADNLPYIKKTFYVTFSTDIRKIIKEFYRYLIILRKLEIDLLVNFEASNRLSVIFSYLSKAKYIVSFKIPCSVTNHFYSSTVDTNSFNHVSEDYRRLAQKAGVMMGKYEYINLREYISPSREVKQILEKYELKGKIVAMHVGSSDNFKGRRWRKENFAKLADMLIVKHGCAVALTGTRSEKSLVEDAIGLAKNKIVNLCDELSVQDLIYFLSYCHLFISNDTGPLHIAASLGINTVGFYGPSNPRTCCNLNDNSISFYKATSCSPCLTNLNAKTSFCKNHICLDSISVEEVFLKITEKFF